MDTKLLIQSPWIGTAWVKNSGVGTNKTNYLAIDFDDKNDFVVFDEVEEMFLFQKKKKAIKDINKEIMRLRHLKKVLKNSK